jgi:hypothetical protein
MKNKLINLSNILTEEEAGLFFYLLIKTFETANHQKVEYTSEDLKDEESLMINVDLDINIPESFSDKILNEYK